MVLESLIQNVAYYGCAFIILLICELLYFRIARYYKIGDKVTKRSSHHEYRLTGGGIIFIISIIIYYIWNKHPIDNLIIGATILSIISFIDDVKNIQPMPRLLVHIAVVFFTFYQIIGWGHVDIFILVMICGVGFINAYNFMDGINGITAGYSLVTLGTILFCFSGTAAPPTQLIITLITAIVIFTFFNFRKKAVCFAGDVGSIVIGYMILYLLIELIWATAEATCFIFVIVYGIDTVFTIIQRLFMGENIFMPHRHHLYQVFANQWHIPHYKVALGYAVSQLTINVGYIFTPGEYKWTYVMLITAILSTLYFIAKRSTRSRSDRMNIN